MKKHEPNQMTTYIFPINGLRHHDFKERLDELYEHAQGRRVSVSIEHDNPGETDAVIVYMGQSCVGYVRSGTDRERACELIAASGRCSLLGRIVGVCREQRLLWMELTAADAAVVKHPADSPTMLAGWTFNGRTLPIDEGCVRLHAMLSNLEMLIEADEPWDADMEEWLGYIVSNMWRDISLEATQQVRRILTLLTAGSTRHDVYAVKADTLQVAVDHMGSPEVRRMQARQIVDMAHSDAMELLMLQYGDDAKAAVRQLPDALVRLFLQDGEIFMGRLWYMHRPQKQIQAVKTLLSMMVRLKDDDGKTETDAIPREWMLAWGARQKDRAKADVVQQIVCSFEMERNNPALALKLQDMLESSCPAPSINNNFAEGSVTMNAGSSMNGDVNMDNNTNYQNT